ncbi:CLUMA_CG017363, isoform A [Clunio marinus]|uniref:CLUMA_CG017363, isoform A n=1 Tax=Clunio marinus TaxID=568069 RepID=A0A1J1IVY3_9DIPT|nr:CLUMA_CG017363, isoform A [Clunio marinus]
MLRESKLSLTSATCDDFYHQKLSVTSNFPKTFQFTDSIFTLKTQMLILQRLLRSKQSFVINRKLDDDTLIEWRKSG